MPRDRVRGLQLMQQALEQTRKDKDKAAVAQFHLDFASMLLNGAGYHEPWRLQYLTDLTKLPDYEEGYYYHSGRRRSGRRAKATPSIITFPRATKTAQPTANAGAGC